MFLDRTRLDTYSIGILWTSDQPVAEDATYTTHEKGMPSVEFETPTLTIMRQQAYALETWSPRLAPFILQGTGGVASLF